MAEQTASGRAMCTEETDRITQLEAERDRLARAVKDWQEIATDAHERIASLMLEEPSKSAGLYAAIDELQKHVALLSEICRVNGWPEFAAASDEPLAP